MRRSNISCWMSASLGGTGPSKRKYYAADCASWGITGWLFDIFGQSSPLIDMYSNASDFMVDNFVAMLFQSHRCEKQYLRIQALVHTVHN